MFKHVLSVSLVKFGKIYKNNDHTQGKGVLTIIFAT